MRIANYKRTLTVALIALIAIGVTSIFYYLYPPERVPLALFRYEETIVIKNNGTEPIEFGGVSTEAFLEFSWQSPRIISVDHEYNISYDTDRNPTLFIDGPSMLEPNETYSATIIWEIESFQREIPHITIEESGNLSDIPQSLINYTKETDPWRSPPDISLDTSDWDNTPYYNLTLREVALLLKGDSENVLRILLNDVEWITKYIQYYSASPTYPVETARNQKGDCDDQSNLLIALLRTQGVPAFLMMGQVYLPYDTYANITDISMDGYLFYESHYTAGHAWAMVYVPPWGWLPCDPVATYPDYPDYAITGAIVRYPITLIFKNVTGVYEEEGADYIGYLREETKRAEEMSIYYWLIQNMEQLVIPQYKILLGSLIFILYTEIVCFTALIIIVGMYDRRRAELPPAYMGGIYCPYCGAENPIYALYCGNCGRRIHKRTI